MAVSLSERDIPPIPEVKHFSEVSFDEIAQRTGGTIDRQYGKHAGIDYPQFNCIILRHDIWHEGHFGLEDYPTLFTILPSSLDDMPSVHIPLRDTAVVLEDDIVSFVFAGSYPAEHVLGIQPKSIRGIVISRTDGISFFSKPFEKTSSQLREAASIASAEVAKTTQR